MNATTQATLSAVAGAAESTASAMMPVILQALQTSAQAASPQAAAAIFAATLLVALIKAGQAGPAEILQMYQQLGPQIASDQAQIDAAAKAAGA